MAGYTPVMSADLTDMLTPTQASRLLGISTTYLMQLEAQGKIPAIRTPYGRLFDRTEVLALKERRQTAPA